VFKASYSVRVASVEHEMTSLLQSLVKQSLRVDVIHLLKEKIHPSPDTGEEGRRGVWIHLQGSSMHVRSRVTPPVRPHKRDKETKINIGEKQSREEWNKQVKSKRWRDIERQVQRKVRRNSGKMKIRKE
jgi:hypothetical protein